MRSFASRGNPVGAAGAPEPVVVAGPPEVRPVAADFSRVPVRGAGSVAERGLGGGRQTLPHQERIQRAFGHHDLSGVRAHVGSRAAAAARALDARAYTTGDRIAFAEHPDLRTAAHEAAHVVQQRAGVQVNGEVGRHGDRYERQADAVADRVARGGSAEDLLDRLPSGPNHELVQRAPIKSLFGAFDTTKYNAVSTYGVDIELSFDPDITKVNATKIGLVQSVRSQLANKAVALTPTIRDRMVPSGTGEGSQIDRTTAGAYGNPIYPTTVPAKGDKLGDTATWSGWGQWGWAYKDAKGIPHHQDATLKDTPTLPGHGNNAEQKFETAALAVEGVHRGAYLGSVSWGWSVDGTGTYTKLPLTKVSDGNPSAAFTAAAKQWNKTSTAGTIKADKSPTTVYTSTYSVAFTVAKDTEVTAAVAAIHGDETYMDVTIQSGPDIGKTGLIKVNDLRDAGGGNRVIPLPIP